MILITCPIHPLFKQTLEAKGLLYSHQPKMEREELWECLSELEGLVISTRIIIDQSLLDKAHKLRWIARLGSGMEHVDMEYARQKGIICYSSPEGNCLSVAEHALGMLLSLMRHIGSSHQEVQAYQWNRQANKGMELSGKKLGIIGYGNTGSAFAGILSGFNLEIMAHDKYKKSWGNEQVKEATLSAIQEECDIISLHLPHTEETTFYANEDFFNALQKKPIFINTSRGSVTDSQALLNALNKGKISGACLDVLENENAKTFSQPENEIIRQLIHHPDVIVTPHIAGYTFEADEKMARVLLKKLGLLS